MAYSVSALEAFNLPMNIKNRSPLRRHMALLLCVSLAILVAGCGQRGPLYLPDKEQSGQEQPEQEAQAQGTQASPEKEPEESDEENS